MLILIYLGIYFLLSILFLVNALRAVKYADALPELVPGQLGAPPVSIIFPVRGRSEHLEECIQSWLNQKYSGRIEYIFSLQDSADPALDFLNQVAGKASACVIVNPVQPGLSGKGSNLDYGFAQAKNEIIIFSDSDIVAPPKTISKMVALLSGKMDLVSALPIHIRASHWPSMVYSYIWNGVLMCLWSAGMLDGRSPGIAGGVICFRRGLLDQIGGVKSFSKYLAEDLVFGSLVNKIKGKLILGPGVYSPVAKQSVYQLLQNLKRSHLIGIHYSRGTFVLSVLAMLLGYSYSLFPLAYAINGDELWIYSWFAVISIRAFYLLFMSYLCQKKFTVDFSFLVGDPLYLICFMISLFNNKVMWGGVLHKVGPGTEIQDS